MTDMYLTYQELRHLGVSQNLISMWKSRKCVDFHMLGGTLYVRYMSIPEQTRSKLALQNVEYVYNSREFYDLYNTIFIKMKYAYERDFIKYLNLYIELGVSNYKSTEYARKHAVWAYFIETYYSSPGIKHPVKEGCKAYNEIYPSRKISESRFRHLISEAQKEGISSIVIEKKKSGRPKIYDDTYKLMVCHFMRSGVAYSKAVIHRMVCEVCEERDMLKPSLRTVKNLCKEQIANTKVYSDRYGEDKMKNELLGYVSLEQAENVGDQFQIDGWTMPFWYYDRDKKKIKRLCFFSVLDAHSKKIVGWWIAKSENTETIMNGLECAIRGVGYYLPYEIVSDNHSFNQTAVSKNFKDTIAQLGCTWSVSSLPGRKLCLERGFRTLGENYAKTEYGYLGQGIKSRNKDARVSPELAEKYLKSGYILTEDQIKIIAVYMVKEWNNGSKIDGKSPNQLYEESARPNIIKLGEHHPAVYDMFNRNMDGKDIRVRRGQVNISRAGTLYEYMLNSPSHDVGVSTQCCKKAVQKYSFFLNYQRVGSSKSISILISPSNSIPLVFISAIASNSASAFSSASAFISLITSNISFRLMKSIASFRPFMNFSKSSLYKKILCFSKLTCKSSPSPVTTFLLSVMARNISSFLFFFTSR